MATVQTKESQHGLTLTLHIGCRVEPFRWEDSIRANTFYWFTLREELSGGRDEPSAVIVAKSSHGTASAERMCDLRQGKTR